MVLHNANPGFVGKCAGNDDKKLVTTTNGRRERLQGRVFIFRRQFRQRNRGAGQDNVGVHLTETAVAHQPRQGMPVVDAAQWFQRQ